MDFLHIQHPTPDTLPFDTFVNNLGVDTSLTFVMEIW